jgi:8-oxo-dGTP pyrophosphatase MutT (NUDIX family)
MPIRRDEAAGGLVVAAGEDGASVVLIAVEKGGSVKWALPKGHFDKGETREQTALREVREETGLEVEILEPLATIDYWFVEKRVRYHKYVHYFLMRSTGGSLDDHDDEVVEVAWFGVEAALERMAYPNERELVASSRSTLDSVVESWRRESR